MSPDGLTDGLLVPAAAGGLGSTGSPVVTIGMFDGVHLGHRALLAEVRAQADRRGTRTLAVTFDRHPLSVLAPGKAPPLLCTLRERVSLLRGAGMDAVLVLRFTSAFSRIPAEDFATDLLLGIGASGIVVGTNFRFGHRAAGDVELLERLGRPHGAEVVGVALTGDGAAPVSSTRIRTALAEGDVRLAAALLGRPFSLPGTVVHGDARGRSIGFPTANLAVPHRLALPALGVYAGRLLDSRMPAVELATAGTAGMPAVTNVGTNPTFQGSTLRIESFVLDADLDLYGGRVGLSFEHRLREERTYATVEALVTQMHADVALGRHLLGAAGGSERPAASGAGP